MTDSPKDKKAAALEKIKELSARKGNANARGGTGGKDDGASGAPARSPKKGGVAHRPQGG